jgi:hypothetical protein
MPKPYTEGTGLAGRSPRDRKALELFGPYAMLNFPEEREQRLREIEAERKGFDTDSHG